MDEALNLLFTIFTSVIDLIFNRIVLFTGVTLGWVFISVIVFGLLISSILNIPKRSQTFRIQTRRGGDDE